MELIKHKTEKSEYLDEQDFKNIPDFVQEIWYDYHQGFYEGYGYMLLRSGDEYALESLSHCSCYGPCEGIGILKEENFRQLEELTKNCTADYLKDVTPVLNLVQQ